ncbi:MBL fold metallo-hydrolase [Natronorubrum halophilum]|uniref:MBL fold metallo-hydrolase n=1 Tax=Natronorubrum halophilum TaxID=1702106 RepID=UPI0010C19B89|nr:MBL fold metallo-hydrolase [Natronorubrum halophilum]
MNESVEQQVDGSLEVAPGVHRFGSERVNWYVVETDGRLLVVDAGLPAHWDQLVEWLVLRGYVLDDIAALVLTHGDPDHIGFAERLRATAGVPVLVHEADAGLVRGTDGGQSAGDLVSMVADAWRPPVLKLYVELWRAGGSSIPPVESVETFEDGDVLDVPGQPRVIHVPGHSPGTCALFLPDRDILLCGDALATIDLRTGRADGPQLMAMFNDDRAQALESLAELETLGTVVLLPGHGGQWRGEMSAAVRLARERDDTS